VTISEPVSSWYSFVSDTIYIKLNLANRGSNRVALCKTVAILKEFQKDSNEQITHKNIRFQTKMISSLHKSI